jgi:UDP-2-acetamido-3-amino-2,3-dideoxy-glucuronate N-acetyltransferase
MKPKYFAAKTAIIEKGAQIGDGTKIWDFSHDMKNVKIGKKCILGQNIFIGENVIIGNNVKIQNNISVYEGVIVEDDVFLGPSCVFTNVKNPRSEFPVNKLYSKTIIKKGVTVGANATIVCGTTINEYAFVGAGSVVTKDIPPFALVYGNPAKIRGKVDKRGRIKQSTKFKITNPK